VVELSGAASGNTSAAFNVLADGVVIGTGTASSTIADYAFTASLRRTRSIASHRAHQRRNRRQLHHRVTQPGFVRE
jgi:hypothetical protein